MFPVHYKYKVKCPHCGKKISHDSYGDMLEGRYQGNDVVKDECSNCQKAFLVKLNKYVIKKIDYKHALPIMKEHFGYYSTLDECVFERLKAQNIFVTKEEDLTIADYDEEQFCVIMH